MAKKRPAASVEAEPPKASHVAALDTEFVPELTPVTNLRPHPKNYRDHPDDQIAHIAQSIEEHGFYRNIVSARDHTILAGHGVVLAAQSIGLDLVPVIRLDLDPNDPQALKILTGDNEIGHLGVRDDRLLSEILKDIKDRAPTGLAGTGYDEAMLANLVFVTRPQSEVKSVADAEHWAGMPNYETEIDEPFKVTVNFASKNDRDEFAGKLGLKLSDAKSTSAWYPPREREDLASLKFEG